MTFRYENRKASALAADVRSWSSSNSPGSGVSSGCSMDHHSSQASGSSAMEAQRPADRGSRQMDFLRSTEVRVRLRYQYEIMKNDKIFMKNHDFK